MLSGVAKDQDVGYTHIIVEAIDTNGGIGQGNFDITIEHFPKAITSIPYHIADIYNKFTYQLAPNIFNDIDGDQLVYSAYQLPSWLNFDAENQIFSGIPSRADAGSFRKQEYTILVRAKDPKGGSADTTFILRVKGLSSPEIVLITFSVLGVLGSIVYLKYKKAFRRKYKQLEEFFNTNEHEQLEIITSSDLIDKAHLLKKEAKKALKARDFDKAKKNFEKALLWNPVSRKARKGLRQTQAAWAKALVDEGENLLNEGKK